VPADFEVRLVKRMNELATKHPRWGYRVVWTLLKAEGWDINRKRVERLWRLEGHRVPPRRTQASGKKAQGLAVNAILNLTATRPNQIWSYDFRGSRLRNGTPFRVLNIVDEFTREALACRVDRSISSPMWSPNWCDCSPNAASRRRSDQTTDASSLPRHLSAGSWSRESRRPS